MNIGITIFNIITIVILGLMLLKGYLSGLWKSLVSLGVLVVGILVLALCVNPIGNAIANPENVGVLQEFINAQLGAGEAVMDPKLADLTLGLAAMIVKMTVLFAGMAFLICVVEPIISLIINLIFFRNKKVETDGKPANKKPLWVRLGGLGVKAVHFFVVMIALFIPVFALNSLVLTYEDVIVEQPNIEEETVEIFNLLNDIDKAFIKAPINLANGMFKTNIEINILSSLSDIKVGSHKINLIQEVSKAAPLVNIILSHSGDEASIIDIIVDGKDEFANFIKESVLLETMYPLIIDFIELNEGFSQDSLITYEDLMAIDFSKDKNNIANIIVIIGDYLAQSNIDLDNISELLSDEELPNFLGNVGEELADTTFVTVILKAAQGLLKDVANENSDLVGMLSALDLTKMTNENISSDMYNIGVLLNKVDKLVASDEEEVEILENLDVLEDIIKVALKLSILKDSEKEFILYILDNFNVLEGYEIDFNSFDFNTVVSWDAEIHALFNIIETCVTPEGELNFNVDDLKEISGLIQGPNGEPCYFTNFIVGSIIKIELEKVVSEDVFDKIDDEYDLTDPEEFAELTESLGAAIEVGTSIEKMEDVENLTAEDITKICDTITALDNHKTELIYDLVVDITTDKGINLDVSEEEFMGASLTEEAVILEEILSAIANDVSDAELDSLVAKAEEETVIIKAFIEQYIK